MHHSGSLDICCTVDVHVSADPDLHTFPVNRRAHEGTHQAAKTHGICLVSVQQEGQTVEEALSRSSHGNGTSRWVVTVQIKSDARVVMLKCNASQRNSEFLGYLTTVDHSQGLELTNRLAEFQSDIQAASWRL